MSKDILSTLSCVHAQMSLASLIVDKAEVAVIAACAVIIISNENMRERKH